MKTRILALIALTAFSAFAQDQTGTGLTGSRFALAAASLIGTPPIAYEWFKDGAKVGDGETFIIEALALANAGAYTVKASNEFGAATSDSYVLRVGTAPSKPIIKSAFTTVTIPKQSAFAVSVDASGDGLKYTWFKNSLPLSGQDSRTLSFSRVNPSYSARYSVRVSNVGGSVLADIVQLRVQ